MDGPLAHKVRELPRVAVHRAIDGAARRRRREWLRPHEFAAFGPGSVIEPPMRAINRDAIAIGRDVHIRPNVWFSATCGQAPAGAVCLTIGDRAELGADLVIACELSVTIGEDVLTADRVFIGDNHHQYGDPTRPIRLQGQSDARPVTIGAGGFLGIGSCVLSGVTIGENAYVGAGAVVVSDVPARCVAVGNPARIVKHWNADAATWMPGPPRKSGEG
jgi:acetyltransferase-like isoleucine patch superfamily enzyme